jgi:hypothetical protein
MKRTLTLLILLASVNVLFAQRSTDTTSYHKDRLSVKVSDRGSDHLLIQYGYDGWAGTPDSIRTKGFSRHFNVYFMLDKPFKTSPKMSLAYGVGIGSSNMFFNNTYIDLKSTGSTLPFNNVDSTNHFKKYKLTTIYAEIPVELRFSSNPNQPNSSFKFALGAKIGTMIKAFTKGKDLVNKGGASVYDSKYIVKESDKKFFNGTKLALTARMGYGIWSLHADYQVTQLIKENAGPQIRPYSIGLTISGL